MNTSSRNLLLSGLVFALAISSGTWVITRGFAQQRQPQGRPSLNKGLLPTLPRIPKRQSTPKSKGAQPKAVARGVIVQTLVNFNGTNGRFPSAALIQARDGNFYGTTRGGGTGTNCSIYGCGTVFRMTPSGQLTTLVNFDRTNGLSPKLLWFKVGIATTSMAQLNTGEQEVMAQFSG